MPTPLEILLDPISIIVLIILGSLMLLEVILPGRKLPKIKGWYQRAIVVFVAYFYLSAYLPLFWDHYLGELQLFNLESVSPILGTVVGLLVLEFLIYVWHRSMHRFNWLWRSFHQMHHSAERIDTLGAFYFSPLDMIGFTMLGSLSLVVIVGVTPEAATYVLLSSIFLAVFQHTNIKTPQWLGYFIQRPESHSLHHGRGIHRYNYSDLPIFDIIFGTFKNPEEFVNQNGFYDGASARIPDMLLFRDVSTEEN
ncbi:sterol desaturase family protein [Aliikangiella sp. IMCC44359]|uniref:sterol desaturase family protein n=1 Tax=Aliikangiella sp. IMCC44359 TaxID=3459125 RepID=UPI00403A83A6